MKKISKKILKILKYIFLLTLVFAVALFIKLRSDGVKIYGGYTEEVDNSQINPDSGSFVVSNVNVLSEDASLFTENQFVYFENNKIVRIDSIPIENKAYRSIDGSGKYLIPGLADMHMHLWSSPNDLLLYVANGVTQIRELLGKPDHLKWKNEIEDGSRLGPEMYIASPRIGTFSRFEGMMMETTQGYLNIETPEDAVIKIKEISESGYDCIKIYSQVSPEVYYAIIEEAKKYNLPVVGHIPWKVPLNEIHTSGQVDIVHFEEIMNVLQREFDPNYELWFGSFYDREEEFLTYVEGRLDEIGQNLLENDIYVTSTLWLTQSFVRQRYHINDVLNEVELDYVNPGISEWVSYIPQGLGWLPEVNRYKKEDNLNQQELIKDKKYWFTYGEACKIIASRLNEMGVKIMAGTDANIPPTVPGFSLHDELIALVNSGMTNTEALRSATVVPEEWFNSKTTNDVKIGRIKEGYDANLLLLNSNPLEDIRNTKDINTVIMRGKVYDKALLNKTLALVKIANDNSRKIPIDAYRN